MVLNALLLLAQLQLPTRSVAPVLAFPEAGLDDSAAYQGYQTRIYRDAAGNTFQIYLDGRQGRVVHLLADAENASVGLSARTSTGEPASLRWDSPRATVARAGRARTVRYSLITDSRTLTLGWFVLGTMRVERDFQYEGRHRRPYGDQPFAVPELVRLVAALESLPPSVQAEHLRSLRAASVSALRARLQPVTRVVRGGGQWTARVTQPSLDGRDTMTVDIRGDERTTSASHRGDSLVIDGRGNAIRLTVTVGTTGAALTPLSRDEIFTADFLAFVDSVRRAGSTDPAARTQARWMERQVRGVELLASREKLMAGLPTYATYFGRDMLVTAMMMRDIWRDDMAAFAVAAALRKLAPNGEVSHEEALGGQAVREAAAEYVALVQAQQAARARGAARAADSLLARAGEVLRGHRRVRENYHMIDDELHLPILLARWLADADVPASRKRAFLRDASDGEPRLTRVLRELGQVARATAPYAAAPSPRRSSRSPAATTADGPRRAGATAAWATPVDASRWTSTRSGPRTRYRPRAPSSPPCTHWASAPTRSPAPSPRRWVTRRSAAGCATQPHSRGRSRPGWAPAGISSCGSAPPRYRPGSRRALRRCRQRSGRTGRVCSAPRGPTAIRWSSSRSPWIVPAPRSGS
ncbi:MAG: hypothetical protein IPF47_00320 [Gemmatimonadetes bacterium]|nr:hypothetical protein [Gemmatimonadota bacterium]